MYFRGPRTPRRAMPACSQDVSFYELVHKILTRQLEEDETQSDDDAERRAGNRESFQSVQFMGPIVNGRLPKPAEMTEVVCHDISTSGFSFFAGQPQRSEQLLVRLNGALKSTYLIAQVIHCRPVADGGEAGFLVGCKFTGRVEL